MIKTKNYQLVINPSIPDTIIENFMDDVARIIDKQTGKIVLLVCYDKECFKHHGYHCCTSKCPKSFNPEYDFAVCWIDDLYYKYIKADREYLFMILLHELGHYLNGDLNLHFNNWENRKQRAEFTAKRQLDQKEILADAFAAGQVGKDAYIKTLGKMIQYRLQRNDKGAMSAIKEMIMRIEYLEQRKQR